MEQELRSTSGRLVVQLGPTERPSNALLLLLLYSYRNYPLFSIALPESET
jgi:hypothetical protein